MNESFFSFRAITLYISSPSPGFRSLCDELSAVRSRRIPRIFPPHRKTKQTNKKICCLPLTQQATTPEQSFARRNDMTDPYRAARRQCSGGETRRHSQSIRSKPTIAPYLEDNVVTFFTGRKRFHALPTISTPCIQQQCLFLAGKMSSSSSNKTATARSHYCMLVSMTANERASSSPTCSVGSENSRRLAPERGGCLLGEPPLLRDESCSDELSPSTMATIDPERRGACRLVIGEPPPPLFSDQSWSELSSATTDGGLLLLACTEGSGPVCDAASSVDRPSPCSSRRRAGGSSPSWRALPGAPPVVPVVVALLFIAPRRRR